MEFHKLVAEKEWVSEDEHLEILRWSDIEDDDNPKFVEDRFGNYIWKWKAPDSYIPEVSLSSAYEDLDVHVGDIYLEEGFIILMDNRDGAWE